uniref:Palmitoyltransferase n=1 Tax=Arcella intermedia TaxID=1963864 RepID=A0A6B2LDS8_9EUKA
MVPFSLFGYYVSYPLFWEEPLYMFLNIFLLTGVLFCQFCCSFCDPGIIPRALNYPIPDITRREVLWEGEIIAEYFCMTCRVWKAPRTHHCSTCNNCVRVFDHHCPWMGNCIAARNYRFFVAYLLFCTVSCVFVVVVCLKMLLRESTLLGSKIGQLISNLPVPFFLSIYCGIVFFGVGGLLFYHFYLIMAGKSTYESVKEEDTTKWNKGIISNVVSFFCSPCPTTLLDLRAPPALYL